MAIESKLNRGPIGRPMGLPEEKKKGSGWIWVIVALVVIIAGAIWWYKASQSSQNPDTSPLSQNAYQAVFLDSGQVYFGKLEKGNENYVLTEVFYLQTGTAGLDQTSNLSLTKLGSEAHGPEDKMEINKEHVLFVENMKNDSKVVKAIQEYKSKKN